METALGADKEIIPKSSLNERPFKKIVEIFVASFRDEFRINLSIPTHACPLLSLASEKISMFWCHSIHPCESPHGFLTRIYGQNKREMDRSLFAQFISQLEDSFWSTPNRGGTLIFSIPEIVRRPIFAFNRIRYISVKFEYPELLENFIGLRRRQWVVKLDNDKYVGLAISGPKIMTFEQWCDETFREIVEYANSDNLNRDLNRDPYRNPIEFLIGDIIRSSINSGELKQWGLFNGSDGSDALEDTCLLDMEKYVLILKNTDYEYKFNPSIESVLDNKKFITNDLDADFNPFTDFDDDFNPFTDPILGNIGSLLKKENL